MYLFKNWFNFLCNICLKLFSIPRMLVSTDLRNHPCGFIFLAVPPFLRTPLVPHSIHKGPRIAHICLDLSGAYFLKTSLSVFLSYIPLTPIDCPALHVLLFFSGHICTSSSISTFGDPCLLLADCKLLLALSSNPLPDSRVTESSTLRFTFAGNLFSTSSSCSIPTISAYFFNSRPPY